MTKWDQGRYDAAYAKLCDEALSIQERRGSSEDVINHVITLLATPAYAGCSILPLSSRQPRKHGRSILDRMTSSGRRLGDLRIGRIDRRLRIRR